MKRRGRGERARARRRAEQENGPTWIYTLREPRPDHPQAGLPVYVGIVAVYRMHKRYWEHCHPRVVDNEPVVVWERELRREGWQPEIVYEELWPTRSLALHWEGPWVQKMLADGYKLLNVKWNEQAASGQPEPSRRQ